MFAIQGGMIATATAILWIVGSVALAVFYGQRLKIVTYHYDKKLNGLGIEAEIIEQRISNNKRIVNN